MSLKRTVALGVSDGVVRSLRLRVVQLCGVVLVSSVFALSTPAYAETAGQYVSQAKSFLEKSDPRAAIIQLKNALKTDPDHGPARLMLGQVYLRAGNGAAAEKELRRARSLGVSQEEWLAPLGKAYILQGNFQDVIDQLIPDAGASDGVRADALAVQALALFGLNERDKAVKKLEEALKADPRNVEALLGSARLALSEQHLEKARGLLKEALSIETTRGDVWIVLAEVQRQSGELDDAVKSFDSALALESGNAAALLGRAAVNIARKELDTAIVDIDMIIKYRPNNPQANFLLGLVAFQKQDYQKTEDKLLQVLRVAPKHIQSHLLLGTVYYSKGQMELAEEYLSTFVQAVPGHLPAIKLLAATRMKSKEVGKAIKLLEEVVSRSPDDAQMMALLGSAYLQNKEFDKGTELLQKAAELNPDMAAIKAQLALGRLASGDMDSAVVSLKSAVDLGQGMVQADMLLIMTYMQKKDFDKAIKAAQILSVKMPDSPVPQNLMGAAELSRGNQDAAKAYFEEALRIQPDFVSAELNLAQLDIRSGNKKAAEKRYLAMHDKDPKNVSIMMSLARLKDSDGSIEAAIKWVEKAHDADPKSLEPMMIMSRYYIRKGDNLKALTTARTMNATHADNPAAIKMLAAALSIGEDYIGSVAELKKLVEVQPKLPESYHLLAAEQMKVGDTQAAQDNLSRALDLNADYLPAIMAKGELAVRDNRVEDAVALARRVQKLAKDSVIGFTMEGDIHMRAKAFDLAAKSYDYAFSKAPTAALALKAFSAHKNAKAPSASYDVLNKWLKDNPDDYRTRMVLAVAYHEKGLFEEAIREYAIVTEKDADNVVVLNNLAWLSYQQGKSGGGVEYARRAVALMPDKPEIIDTLGWLLVNQDQVAEGMSYLQKAVTQAPHRPDMRFHLSYALHKQGRDQDARMHLKRALSSDQPFEEHKKAMELDSKLNK